MKSIFHYSYWIKRDFVRWTIKHESWRIWLVKHNLSLYLKMFYYNWQGKWPNLKHPTNLNEALMRLSVKHQKDKVKRDFIVKCADKYAVREYVEQMGYGDTLNELYGAYNNVDDIDFDALPNQFVMKMNNASGRNFICKDKRFIDIIKIKAQFKEWLNDDKFGLASGEWQYSLMKPMIVIEKYLSNLGESMLIDYKFNVIGGNVYSCFVAYNRNAINAHNDLCMDNYDINWNRTEASKEQWHKDRRLIPKPKNYERMLKMASDLCGTFPYVRFDVYEVDGYIIFGEMTFTPNGCVLDKWNDDFLVKAYNDNKQIFSEYE